MTEQIHPQLLSNFNAIPLLQTMQARVLSFDGRQMRVAAPLAPNLNDKGTAFGGSLTSLMTIAGWLLVGQMLAEGESVPEVYVTESNVHFNRVVTSDMVASAWLAANTMESAVQQLRTRGKVRLRTESRLENSDGSVGAVMTAVYAAIVK